MHYSLYEMSRFSTNVRSMSSTLTDAFLCTTESFSAGTRVRSQSPTTVCHGSLQMSVQWVKTPTDARLITTKFFLAITSASSESHTTPNTECVTSLHKCQFSELSPTDALWETQNFSRQLLVCVVNHTLLWIQSGVCHDFLQMSVQMMITAFITWNSSLVPMIDGLYSSNAWEFEFRGD